MVAGGLFLNKMEPIDNQIAHLFILGLFLVSALYIVTHLCLLHTVREFRLTIINFMSKVLKMKLSIIIPRYNCAERINKLLMQILSAG